jgi:cobyrinic acid a,c-diamide synthase
MLEKCGIKIEEFSPLYGRGLPEDADGILLGGGYPELYAEDLEDNIRMRESIREAIEDGMPCLAECGGFMYLLDEMADADGNMHKMCGVFEGSSQNTGRLGRFGYVTISKNESEAEALAGDQNNETILSGLCIKGHEFHYYDSDNNGDDAVAVKPGSGRSWDCMHVDQNMLAGYPHLYYPSCPELIARFREKMAEYRQKRLERAGREE